MSKQTPPARALTPAEIKILRGLTLGWNFTISASEIHDVYKLREKGLVEYWHGLGEIPSMRINERGREALRDHDTPLAAGA